ncbi:MAG: AI-2E family transporter [Lachnospiraceae bacterium]|nr:AI-2E family transporter [Lachnospiraceae bacterium]
MRFNNKGNKYIYWGLTLFLSLSAVILFAVMMFNFGSVIEALEKIVSICMPLIYGLVISFLLSPLINKLEAFIYSRKSSSNIFKDKKTGEDLPPLKQKSIKGRVRVLCIAVVYILFIFMIYWFFSLVIPEVISSIENITKQFPEYRRNFLEWLKQVLVKYPNLDDNVNRYLQENDGKINTWISEHILGRAQDVILTLSTGVFNIVKVLFNLIMGLLISIYLISSKETFIGQFKKTLYSVLKRETTNALLDSVRFVNNTFLGFFGGKIIDSFIIGVLCFILTSIIGTPYAALVSLIVGVTNIIPYFGPFIGAIPSALLILMIDPKQCLYFVIMILILQQLDGNVIGPAIIGQSTGLTAFWVIFAITVFGGLWGPLGMLVGVPLFAVIYTGIRSFVVMKLKEKGLPEGTSSYVRISHIDEEGNFVVLPEEEKKRAVKEKKNQKN